MLIVGTGSQFQRSYAFFDWHGEFIRLPVRHVFIIQTQAGNLKCRTDMSDADMPNYPGEHMFSGLRPRMTT
jgi:hypothetical protein